MPGGRPTKYKPEYCEKVIEHMGQGLSFESFAGTIGVNQDTLHEWCKRHEEFSESKKIGREKSRIFWEKLGIDGATGRLQYFNAATWIFNMKNRFNWTDKQELSTGENKSLTLSYNIAKKQ